MFLIMFQRAGTDYNSDIDRSKQCRRSCNRRASAQDFFRFIDLGNTKGHASSGTTQCFRADSMRVSSSFTVNGFVR